MSDSTHWNAVYTTKEPNQVSWFRPHLDRSLAFLDAIGLDRSAGVIDVGAGASTFVDDLLDRGFTNITVLDLAEAALKTSRDRLVERAAKVHWLCADVTTARLPEASFAFWHDRAVFHFLVDGPSRARYVDAARRSLAPGGHLVVATFGPRGPERCSGLEVTRFTPEGLCAEFGPGFAHVTSSTETHVTPWGAEQEFVYCHLRLQG